MRAPFRRSLALAALLTLLLSISTVGTTVVLGRGPTSTTIHGVDVDASTIPQLQDLMNGHRLTSVQLVQFYLQRIAKLNPTLHAVITTSPTALAEARAADKARRQGDDRPLLGIPILVKDNVNTSGMPTTAGSWALAGSTPSDAFIIQQLKAAGAIVIGKANLSEWANFRSIPSSSGWSGIGGQNVMAYVLDRNPCGSSSGSGVGVSADLAVAAIGTETDGSIVCPSGANGIVGIKPTLGLLSRAGVVPISADQDTAGPMARNVTDAAVLLGALTGVDANDPATLGQVALTDYTPFLDDESLDGANIGVWREGTDTFEGTRLDADVDAVMTSTIAALTAQGATVTEIELPLDDVFQPEFDALLCEFKTDIATYLETYTAAGFPKTLAELTAFNLANPDLEEEWNDAIFEAADETDGRGSPACDTARAATTPVVEARLAALLAEFDAIIAPTNGPAWLTDFEGPDGGDLSLGNPPPPFIGSSTASAITGWANITVPAGYARDGTLPIGVSFIGGAWDEPDLIGFAYDFEQATLVRVPPTFIPTIGD